MLKIVSRAERSVDAADSARGYPSTVSYSSHDPQAPWFRLGRLEVTTTVFVLVVAAVTTVVFVVEPTPKVITTALGLNPAATAGAQVWRLLTWPFGAPLLSIWGLLAAAMFWYFGGQVEQWLGRRRMAWFLGITTVAMGVIAVLASLTIGLPNTVVLAGLSLPQSLVLLLYIAENPQARFFFGIPAWVVGIVLVGIDVLQYLAFRMWVSLVVLLAGLAVAALVARGFGLLTAYPAIPRLPMPGAGAGRAGRPGRGGRAPRRRGRGAGPTVVSFPSSTSPVSKQQRELDALLDKIHVSGLESLSDKEQSRLRELSRRQREL